MTFDLPNIQTWVAIAALLAATAHVALTSRADNRLEWRPRRDRDMTAPWPSGLLAVAVALAGTLWPVDALPGDRGTYARNLTMLATGDSGEILGYNDLLWRPLMQAVAAVSTCPVLLFGLVSAIVMGCWWVIARRTSPAHTTLMLVVVTAGFFFMGYLENALRQAIAEALVVMAIILAATSRRRLVLTVAIVATLVAVGIHKSILLLTVAAVVARYLDNPRPVAVAWLVALVVSALAGDLVATIVDAVARESRLTHYLTGRYVGESEMAFRLDFVIFSAIPIAAGLWYRLRCHYDNRLYTLLLNTYIVANAAWLLVIRAGFTDRIAHLSWVLMPLLLFMPLLDNKVPGPIASRRAWLFGAGTALEIVLKFV